MCLIFGESEKESSSVGIKDKLYLTVNRQREQ